MQRSWALFGCPFRWQLCRLCRAEKLPRTSMLCPNRFLLQLSWCRIVWFLNVEYDKLLKFCFKISKNRLIFTWKNRWNFPLILIFFYSNFSSINYKTSKFFSHFFLLQKKNPHKNKFAFLTNRMNVDDWCWCSQFSQFIRRSRDREKSWNFLLIQQVIFLIRLVFSKISFSIWILCCCWLFFENCFTSSNKWWCRMK